MSRIPADVSIDDAYARLLEEVSDRIQSGQDIDLDDYKRRYGRHAQQLEQLLPAMQALANLGENPPALHDDLAADHKQPSSRVLGDFHILREIGRGGMGVVYEAEQLSLGRRVALKVLPFAAVMDARQLQRFSNEAIAAGSLEHPNIVAVYSIGCERGVHFYAMRLVEGQSLAELVSALRQEDKLATTSRRPSVVQHVDTQPVAMLSTQRETDAPAYFRSVASLGVQAARALQYAHDAGLVHRDIKPSNLLINADGHLWITDFGLAQLPDGGNLTMTGDILGTLRYMSPEQALGKSGVIDQRSDVYSLGLTLYELATLQPAITGSDRQEMLRQISDQEPIAPRKHSATMPRDLETIILKATSKDSSDRYVTSRQLAHDLQNFLDSKPIVARRPGVVGRGTKWIRRHRAVASAVGVTALVTVAVSVVLLSLAYQSERTQRRTSELQRARAESNLLFARGAVDEMYTNIATQWMARDDQLSSIQEGFLRRAVHFYERLANESSQTPAEQKSAATAFTRIGKIHQHLDEHQRAIGALKKSITLGQMLLASMPNDRENLAAMIGRHGTLARSLQALANLDEAEKAYQKAREYHRLLSSQFGSSDHDPLRGRYQLDLAALLARRGRLKEAEVMAREAVEAFRELHRQNFYNVQLCVWVVKGDYFLSDIFRAQQRFDAARELCENTLKWCTGQRKNHFRDSRQLLAMEEELETQLGEIVLARGDVNDARRQFRRALDVRKRNLKSGREPIVFFHGVLAGTTALDESDQPASFCSYVETQLRLVSVLLVLNRPYAAERVLGDCAVTTQQICDTRPDILRYRVARANTWAQISRLLANCRPEESHPALTWAASIWQDTLKTFPHAHQYRSGIHLDVNDFDWFTNTFPEPVSPEQLFEYKQFDEPVMKTAIVHHAKGLAAFRAGGWQGAIDWFKKAAKQRTCDRAYDWFFIAAAYKRLESQDEARQWYDKAETAMTENSETDKELIRLRNNARKLLSAP